MPKANRSYLDGMRGAREALAELSKGVARNVGKRALRQTGDYFVGRLKPTLPVSNEPSNPTKGSLRASAQVVSSRAEKGRPRVALLIDDIAAVPGEFGTSNMKPHLKVRATVDASRAGGAAVMAAAIKSEVDAVIQRAAAKGRKK